MPKVSGTHVGATLKKHILKKTLFLCLGACVWVSEWRIQPCHFVFGRPGLKIVTLSRDGEGTVSEKH